MIRNRNYGFKRVKFFPIFFSCPVRKKASEALWFMMAATEGEYRIKVFNHCLLLCFRHSDACCTVSTGFGLHLCSVFKY